MTSCEVAGPDTVVRLGSPGELRAVMLDSMSDGVLLVDLSGRIVDCNRAFHEKLGYSKAELLGKNAAELDAPVIPPGVFARTCLMLERPEALFETAHRRKDGSLMRVELESKRVESSGGTFCFAVVRDVSERERSDPASREQERMFRAVVETSSAGFWAIDERGRFLEVNEAYAKRSGYSREELLTMSIPDLEAAETAEETKAHLDKIIREGHDRFETVHRTKSGELWPVEVVVSFWPLRSGLIVVFITDLSHRKKAQEAIEARQKELRKLSEALRQAGEGVMITDRDAVIEYVNPAFTAMTGYSPEDVIGKTAWVLNADAADAALYEDLWKTLDQGRKWRGTLTGRRQDGSVFPAMISAAPIFDDQGRVTNFVSIHKDMSVVQKMERQLLEVQKTESMGTLVGGLAHDFNNMLAALLGNVYLAKLSPDDTIGVRESLETIEHLAEHGADVVKQLLTFARKDVVEMKPVALNGLIAEGFKLAKSTIPKNIEHRLDVCDEELVVVADTTQLQQVMINLSNNARDAVADVKAPRIEWILSRSEPDDAFAARHPEIKKGSFAKISVKDNGHGIEPEHLRAVFDPFFTTKPPGKGSGLGLAMAYGAVQRHGGVLTAESKPGEGAAFHIHLPLVESDAAQKKSQAPSTARRREATVLLVDDDENMRRTTAAVLRKMGHRVLEAVDGAKALALYRAHRRELDLIMTDVIMPGKGGVELAEEVRREDEELPILLMTGYDRERVASGDVRIGNCHVVGKPLSYEALGELIDRLLPAP